MHHPSFCLNRSVTAATFAWPRVAFIAWPTRKLITVGLPPWYCSTCLGLAAITSAMIFSSAPAPEICFKPSRSTITAAGSPVENIFGKICLASLPESSWLAISLTSCPRFSALTGESAISRPSAFSMAIRSPITQLAVIGRVFLAAHAESFVQVGVIETRLLHHAPAALDQRYLPGDLELDGLLQEAERVQVLDLGAGAERLRALEPHADVGVAAQIALLHVAGGDLDELHHLLQLGQVGVRLVGAAHVGFADDFDERRAAAVQIDIGGAAGILEAVVHALAGVVFHVDAGDADALGTAVHHDIHEAMLGHRLVVLGDLVALGQVRVEVVLAREPRKGAYLAVQRERALDGQFHGLAAEHGERAGKAEANRAHVGVGRRAETGGAAAEDLGGRGQLHVDFEPDDRLVARDHLGRRRGDGGGGHGVLPL